MATKKTIEIDLNISEAQKSLDKFGGTLEDVKGEGVQPLNFAIGELEDRLYEMAAAGDTSSKEFKEMSAEVGKMKKVIIDVDMAVDGMSQTLSQNVGGALSGVAGGFELAQGAMGAFGASGEKVEEALLKVQSAMAISQGIQTIRESIASFQALRKAIMANTVVQKLLNFVMSLNPIGLIVAAVVGLGLAIYALLTPIQSLLKFFGILGDDAETAAEANKRLTASIEKQEKAIERLQARQDKMHDNRMRQLELSDASEEEKHKATLDRLAQQEAMRLKGLKGSKQNIKELTAAYKQAKREEDDETARSLKEKIQSEKENVRKLKLNHEEYTLAKQEEDKRYAQSVKEQNDQITKDEQDALKERSDNYKAYLDAKLASDRLLEDLRLELVEEGEEREIELAKIKFERELQDSKLRGEAKAEEEKLREEILRQEILEIKAKYRPEELELRNAEVLGNQEKNRQILKDDRATAEEKKRIAKEETRAKMQEAGRQYESATQGLQMIADFAKVIAGKNEKAQKVAFNIQKAASIAQATIDTYKNATAAYGSFASIPVVGVPLGIAAAAAAVAAGIANVRSIASTKFEGGGGGSPSTPSAPSIGGGGGGSSPAQFNVVGGTGVNQLAESLGGQDKVVKSYVVSGDVTTAQSLDRNRIDTASI